MDQSIIEKAAKEFLTYFNPPGLPKLEMPINEAEYGIADTDAITYRVMAVLLSKELGFKSAVFNNVTISLETAKAIVSIIDPYFKWVLEVEDPLIVFEYNYEFMRTAWENEETDYCTLCGIRFEESNETIKVCAPVCPPPIEEEEYIDEGYE